MRTLTCLALLTAILAFRFGPEGQPLTSVITWDGILTTEVLIENMTDHDVRIRPYFRGHESHDGSFLVGAGRRVPLQVDYRSDAQPAIDSPVLFFRASGLDSFMFVFDEQYKVSHYSYIAPSRPFAKRLLPGVARNIAWIGSWDHKRYRDLSNGKLIDGFRYQITEADFQYAAN